MLTCAYRIAFSASLGNLVKLSGKMQIIDG